MARSGSDDPTVPSGDHVSSGEWSVGALAERWLGDREARPDELAVTDLFNEDDTLVVRAGTDPGTPDLLAAAARAERRGDWVHAARALDRAAAQRTPVASIRLARAHLASGDLAGCRDALTRPPGDESPATRARFVARCADPLPVAPGKQVP